MSWTMPNFSVERMPAGGGYFQIRGLGVRSGAAGNATHLTKRKFTKQPCVNPPSKTKPRSMSSQTITVQIYRDGAMCFIPVPFDPKAVFGMVRAPVKVTLNGYRYR